MPWDVAKPQAIEARVNSAIPPRNNRRCPSRSPRRPPNRRKPPKVSRYPFTTHASEDCEKPRSRLIEGSATFTIVLSSTIISEPRQTTIRAIQRERVSEIAEVISLSGLGGACGYPDRPSKRADLIGVAGRSATRSRAAPGPDLGEVPPGPVPVAAWPLAP